MDYVMLAESTTSSAGGGAEALLIGGMVALANALVELGKVIAAKARNGKNGSASGGSGSSKNGVQADTRQCIECQGRVHAVHEIVARTDQHGVPLVYGSHQLAGEIRDATVEIRGVARATERLTERIEESMGKQPTPHAP